MSDQVIHLNFCDSFSSYFQTPFHVLSLIIILSLCLDILAQVMTSLTFSGPCVTWRGVLRGRR